jgi:hypothetical protein
LEEQRTVKRGAIEQLKGSSGHQADLSQVSQFLRLTGFDPTNLACGTGRNEGKWFILNLGHDPIAGGNRFAVGATGGMAHQLVNTIFNPLRDAFMQLIRFVVNFIPAKFEDIH